MKTDLPYLHEDRDRYGNIRVYFRRRPGARKIRIRALPGTPEFLAEYAEAASPYANETVPERKAASAPTIDTFRWLCTRYMGDRNSPFQDLAENTQAARRGILEQCWDERIAPEKDDIFGDCPLKHFTSKHVRILRDRKRGTPETANNRLKAIRAVFGYGVEEELGGLTADPTIGVKRRKSTKTGGRHSWTIDEVHQYEERHPVGTKARLALALLLYLGQRRSDIPQFGRQHVRNGWLIFTQHKNRNRNPVRLELPIIAELQRIIDASPTGDLTFLVTEFNKAFSIPGFGNKMRQWCDEAGLPHCSAHGLRKAAATRLADLGCTHHEIMAITGHQTLKEVENYTKAADQKRLAKRAMNKLSRSIS